MSHLFGDSDSDDETPASVAPVPTPTPATGTTSASNSELAKAASDKAAADSGGDSGGDSDGGGDGLDFIGSDSGSEDIDDDISDGEDDNDVSEEEEENVSKKRKRPTKSKKDVPAKKKKKAAVSKFFDEMADDDSDDDEDDEDLEGSDMSDGELDRRIARRSKEKERVYTQAEIAAENMDDDQLDLMRAQDRRRNREGIFDAEADVSAVADDIVKRHKMAGRRVGAGGRGGMNDIGGMKLNRRDKEVNQQSLVPSVTDPQIWMFGCKIGKEEELVLTLLNKAIAIHQESGGTRNMGITGAVAGKSKGRIYVEGFSEPAVLAAVQGVRMLHGYRGTIVPINDMTTLMDIQNDQKPVKKDEWVRMNRNPWKGDLARVVEVRESGLKAIVKAVPRIDLGLYKLKSNAERRKRKKEVRPPQTYFNDEKVNEASNGGVGSGRMPGMSDLYSTFEGNFYRDGFLYREVQVGSVVKQITSEVDRPTVEELQMFLKRKAGQMLNDDDDEDNDENGFNDHNGRRQADIEAEKSLLDELAELQGDFKFGRGKKGGTANTGLLVGEIVKVIEGDLKGIKGKIISLNSSSVKIAPIGKDFVGMREVEFLLKQVQKHFEIGCRVKITEGQNTDDTGVVMAIKNDPDSEVAGGSNDALAIILTDITNKELSVRLSQITQSNDISLSKNSLDGYELHDLVFVSGQNDHNEVAIIIRVGREDFTVMNGMGITRTATPEELRGICRTSRNSSAVDNANDPMRVGDTVTVLNGKNKGKQATIKHTYRHHLFVYSHTLSDHTGIFTVRGKDCLLSGNKKSQRINTSGGGRQKKGSGETMLKKTVKITQGQWKGYLGTVSDETDTLCQIELHTRLKKISVNKAHVRSVGNKFGSFEKRDAVKEIIQSNNMNPNMGGQTPSYAASFAGSGTPMLGGTTPMHGGSTPSYNPNEEEESIWRPGTDVDKTPVHQPVDDGMAPLGSQGMGAQGVGSYGDSGYGDSGYGDGGYGVNTGGNEGGDNTNDGNNVGVWTPSDAGISSVGDSYSESAYSTSNYSVTSDNYTPLNSAGGMGGMGVVGAGAVGMIAPWFMEGVCVVWQSNKATIQSITGGSSQAVIVMSDGSTNTVGHDQLVMAQCEANDPVIVTGGDSVGKQGSLVCIDGGDAIVKDESGEFVIVDVDQIAKYDVDSIAK